MAKDIPTSPRKTVIIIILLLLLYPPSNDIHLSFSSHNLPSNPKFKYQDEFAYYYHIIVSYHNRIRKWKW